MCFLRPIVCSLTSTLVGPVMTSGSSGSSATRWTLTLAGSGRGRADAGDTTLTRGKCSGTIRTLRSIGMGAGDSSAAREALDRVAEVEGKY